MDGATYQPARTEEERASLRAVLGRSFAVDPELWSGWMDRVGHETLRVVYRRGRIEAGLGFYRAGQYWGGRAVPFAAVAGVGVAPEARGDGLAKWLMQRALCEMREDGFALSGLYASTTTLYRSVGYEQAGTNVSWSVSVSELPKRERALECELVGEAEGPALQRLYDTVASRTNGHLARSAGLWARVWNHHDLPVHVYRFGPASAPQGYVVLTQPSNEPLLFHVAVRDCVLATPAASDRFVSLVRDMRSLAGELRWFGPPGDAIVSLLPEDSATVRERNRWMLRLLDPTAALERRGYAAAIQGVASFELRDASMPMNEGRYRFEVRGGEAKVNRAASAPLVLDTRALAALYAGSAHPRALLQAGLASGAVGELETLAALLAGAEPWLPDFF